MNHVVGVRQQASGPSPPPRGGQPEGIMLVRGGYFRRISEYHDMSLHEDMYELYKEVSGGYQNATISVYIKIGA